MFFRARRKGAKKPLETRQRFASWRLCARCLPQHKALSVQGRGDAKTADVGNTFTLDQLPRAFSQRRGVVFENPAALEEI